MNIYLKFAQSLPISIQILETNEITFITFKIVTYRSLKDLNNVTWSLYGAKYEII